MHYGEKLAGLMDWKGEGKTETAKATGIPLSTLKFALNDPEPNTGVCIKVLSYLQLPIDTLFSERDLTPVEAGIIQEVKRLSAGQQKALLELLKAM